MLISDVYLWLAYSQVSTRKLNKLLELESPSAVWNSFDGDARKYNFDEKTFSVLKRTRSEEYISRIKQYLAANHIEYITRVDPLFPEGLVQKEVDPPLVLFYKGSIELAKLPCVAVVGTRRASQYGKYAAERIAGGLAAAGFAVVSGLATGIDGYSHSAALDAGGKTIAVLGSGHFNMTPVSNARLFDRICAEGLVVSEYPPDVHASVYTFPQRNRIISGMSKGVVVVEAAQKSGSLITADFALEQGRDVFAVPGDIDKPRSKGTNTLIKQGATAVTCAEDILEFYGADGVNSPKTVELDFTEQRVMELLSGSEKSFDALVEESGISPAMLNTALLRLSVYGLIHEKAKNVYTAS